MFLKVCDREKELVEIDELFSGLPQFLLSQPTQELSLQSRNKSKRVKFDLLPLPFLRLANINGLPSC